MLKLVWLLAITFCCAPLLNAQNTDYGMAEITFMKPKIGMEKDFVKAVANHNEIYHKDGPYKARLDQIYTGKQAGWYVWIMGPCTFTDLDSRNLGDAHTDHWDTNVANTVAKYGRTEFWKYNPKLSFDGIEEPIKISNLWLVDIADNEYHRFKDFMEKIQKAFAKMNRDNMRVYDNQFNEDDGRDVVIVWSSTKWADMDEQNDDLEATYEEIHGKGTWQTAIDDWRDFTVSVSSSLWLYDMK